MPFLTANQLLGKENRCKAKFTLGDILRKKKEGKKRFAGVTTLGKGQIVPILSCAISNYITQSNLIFVFQSEFF